MQMLLLIAYVGPQARVQVCAIDIKHADVRTMHLRRAWDMVCCVRAYAVQALLSSVCAYVCMRVTHVLAPSALASSTAMATDTYLGLKMSVAALSSELQSTRSSMWPEISTLA